MKLPKRRRHRGRLRRRDGALVPVSIPSSALVDWRAINERQWRTGIQATLGEDGEALYDARLIDGKD